MPGRTIEMKQIQQSSHFSIEIMDVGIGMCMHAYMNHKFRAIKV